MKTIKQSAETNPRFFIRAPGGDYHEQKE